MLIVPVICSNYYSLAHSLEICTQYYVYNRRSRDSTVGIATGYGLVDLGIGVRVPVGLNIFSSLRRPDRLLGPPNLLSNGYRRLFPQR
jgi:hypothetical protein